jgi:DNA-binding CsgD family transcriptional regulator
LNDHFQTLGAGIDALNSLKMGIFMAGAGGKVISMNRCGEYLLAQADGLSLDRECLRGATAAATRLLRNAIVQAVRTAEGAGSSPGGRLTMIRPSGSRPYSIVVTPVRSHPYSIQREAVRCVIFVTDPDAVSPADPEVLATLYDLTPGEAKVGALIARGKDLRVVCDELRITRNTAKTHLQHIFQKLGIRRQAELAVVLSKALGPL